MGRGYVVQRSDGAVFVGNGYGGPGRPVPYFHLNGFRMQDARVFRTERGALDAAKRIVTLTGSSCCVRPVDVDPDGMAVEWADLAKEKPDGQA